MRAQNLINVPANSDIPTAGGFIQAGEPSPAPHINPLYVTRNEFNNFRNNANQNMQQLQNQLNQKQGQMNQLNQNIGAALGNINNNIQRINQRLGI